MKDTISKSIGAHILQAARLHRARSAQLLKELGLFPGQERVLQLLASNETMTMGDLANQLRVRPPTISKTVARLSAQNLLERRGSSSDARIVEVFLTEEGRLRAERIVDIWNTVEDEMTEGLDGKDRRRLRKSLKRAARNLSGSVGTDAIDIDTTEEDDDL